MRLRWLRLAAMVAAPLVLIGGPAVTPAASAATAGGCQTWNGGQPDNIGTAGNTLKSIAAVSGCDVWAVGVRDDEGRGIRSQPLIEHWDGTSWTQPTSRPNVTGILSSVAVVSATDVWAVGYYFPDPANSNTLPLIEHWDGAGWTQVASPNPGGSGVLVGVSVDSATDVWAVGGSSGAAGPAPVILHWDGASWTPAGPLVGIDSPRIVLRGVSALSPTDVWAVGDQSVEAGSVPAILHWDGASWTQQPAPFISGTTGILNAVSAVSASNVWAVGAATGGAFPQTMIMHWDGTGWFRDASPNPGGASESNELDSVAAGAANDVWMAGFHLSASGAQSIVLHWGGLGLNPVVAPGQTHATATLAVSDAGGGQAWVAGFYSNGDAFAAPVPVVPAVTGDTLTDAISALRAAGMADPSPGLTFTTSCPVPGDGKDHVLTVSPPAGTRVPAGTLVDATICDAAQVPSVIGDTQAAAASALTAAGLNLGTVTETASCSLASQGTVTATSPAQAGQVVHNGSAVNLTVCHITSVTVPDIVGLTLAGASSTVKAAGLSLGNETNVVVCDSTRGKVLDQTPGAGAVAPIGSAVSFSLGVKPSGTNQCG